MALTRATDKIIANADGNLNLSGIVTASSFRGDGSQLTGIDASTLKNGSDTKAQANASGVVVTGVLTATSYSGDGSNLTNLPAGLGTALSSTQTSPLNKLYYTNEILSIGATVTVDHPATGTGAYTQYADIRLDEGADLIIEDGDDVIPDILGLGTDGGGLGAGGSGRIRVDSITNKNANGAPNFTNGVTGTAATFTNSSTIAGIVTLTSGGVDTVGVVTATSFKGDGSQLSNITSTTINNNADNRVITGSGTANTLEGESNLTFDGNNLAMSGTGVFTLTRNSRTLTLEGNYGNEGHPAIKTSSGHDLRIFTSGNNERFRIGSSGQFGIGGATYGTAGQVLTSGGASAAPTWGGAGKVLQVQYKRGGVTTTSNSGGWTDSVESGLNVDITPTSSTSFIIVQMHSVGGNTSSGRSYFLRLRRKINNTGDTGVASFQIGDGSNGGMQSLALTHVEVPNNWNTSHAINYRIRFGQDGSGTARFDYATTSVLYAMEVQP